MRILLLPGLGGSVELFDFFVSETPEGFSCSVVTYPNDRDWSYAEYAAHVLEHHIPDSPFLLVGESFSGPVAVLVAEQQPPGLAGVVLCNSFALRPKWKQFRRLPLASLFRRPVPTFLVGCFLVGFRDASRLMGPIRRAHDAVHPEVLEARFRLALQVDVRQQLSGLTESILYLRGKQDRLIGSRSAREVVSALPTTRLVRIDGPHLLLQVNPREAWKVIQTFVAEDCSP